MVPPTTDPFRRLYDCHRHLTNRGKCKKEHTNKAYCFHELVLNLPAPLDIQWPKCFQLQGEQSPPDLLTRSCAPGPRWGLCPQTPVIGSCSALAMVPSQPLTPSAAYDCHRHLTTGVSARWWTARVIISLFLPNRSKQIVGDPPMTCRLL